MTSKAIDNHGITETYLHVEKLLNKLVSSFTARYKVDYSELHSVAAEGFLVAMNSYVPSEAKFSTWVTIKVSGFLMDHIRKCSKQTTRISYDCDQSIDSLERKEGFNLTLFLNELSDDARTVGSLVFHSPGEIMEAVKGEEWNEQLTTVGKITRFLSKLGWSAARVMESVNEIREALS